MTESLWRGGGCRQDRLGPMVVYIEPKSHVRALGRKIGDVEPRVEAERKERTRCR